MPIFAYTGLPGHGKSYGVVENQILPALRAGRHVVTNIPLNEPAIREEIRGGVIDPFPLDEILKQPETIYQHALPGCLLVMDELWKIFPAGVKANNVPEPFKALLAEHRHMVDEHGNSMQIVFVTQDLAQVASFARQLVEQTFIVNKLVFLGLAKKYRVDVYSGAVTGTKAGKGRRLREIYGTFDKRVFRMYQSHTKSQSGESGANEKTIEKRGLVWRSPIWWAGGPVVLALGIWGISSVVSFFSGDHIEPKIVPERPAAPVQARTYAPVRVGPAPRISGYMKTEDPMQALVILEDGISAELVRFVDACSFGPDGLMECTWRGLTFESRGPKYAVGNAGYRRDPRFSARDELRTDGTFEGDSSGVDAERAREHVPVPRVDSGSL